MPTLDTFLLEDNAYDNTWWTLGSGDHQVLFDEALERIRGLSLDAIVCDTCYEDKLA